MEKTPQETLEEAAKNTTSKYINEREKQTAYLEFIEGAKRQANQNQEVINKLISIIEWYDNESDVRPDAETFMWFEQFKNKQ